MPFYLSTSRPRRKVNEILHGRRQHTTRPSRYFWPRQGKPAESEWIHWREALAKTFCVRNKTLRQPLGRWFSDGLDSWEWFYEPNEERLYRNGNGKISFYPRAAGVASRSAVLRFRDPVQTGDIPGTALRATVAFQASKVVLTGFALNVSESAADTSPATLRQWIEGKVNPNARWAVKDFVAGDEGAIVAEAIRRGTCTGVSDGSSRTNLARRVGRPKVTQDHLDKSMGHVLPQEIRLIKTRIAVNSQGCTGWRLCWKLSVSFIR